MKGQGHIARVFGLRITWGGGFEICGFGECYPNNGNQTENTMETGILWCFVGGQGLHNPCSPFTAATKGVRGLDYPPLGL